MPLNYALLQDLSTSSIKFMYFRFAIPYTNRTTDMSVCCALHIHLCQWKKREVPKVATFLTNYCIQSAHGK